MSQKSYFLFSLSIILCSFKVYAQQTVKDTIMHNGVERTFVLYVPEMYSASSEVPLLINMHGRNGTAEGMMNYGDFRPIADTAGFIIVHPQGLKDELGRAHWNFRNGVSQPDDVGFLNTLMDQLIADYSIDDKRIYSTGFSQGGFMSFYMVCNSGDRLAGIGSVGGAITDSVGCGKGFPMPIIQIHGTSDDQVGYDHYKVGDLMKILADYNGCNPTPSEENLPDINTSDNSTVTKIVYEGGKNGATVEHFRVNNGEHTWPGAKGNSPFTNYDMDASKEIWRFLSQYDKNGKIEITNTPHVERESFKLYPNPTNGVFQVESTLPISEYAILNSEGRVISLKDFNAEATKIVVTTDNLAPGIYTFRVVNNQGTNYKRLIVL